MRKLAFFLYLINEETIVINKSSNKIKRFFLITLILVTAFSSYSQVQVDSISQNEYEESSFQGQEEISYNPKSEIFVITSCEFSLNEKVETLRRGVRVKVYKNKTLNFSESQGRITNYIKVDYEKNTLTFKLNDKIEVLNFDQKNPSIYYWGVMPEYESVTGTTTNSKKEKLDFTIEAFGGNGGVIFYRKKKMIDGGIATDIYYCHLNIK
jgi:hypothetical protein